tara:strand:- start:1945 stop:2115 length:171 start_codon:yes stop_codon:yes gene_type:complete
MILELIHVLKQRQAEIRMSLVDHPVSNHEVYLRIVGEYQGLQWTLDTLNEKLAEKD